MTPLDRALADRIAAEEDLDHGLTGILVEPLTALAGGLLGGALVTLLAWRTAWRQAERRHARTVVRLLP